jgi:hypothetical protein
MALAAGVAGSASAETLFEGAMKITAATGCTMGPSVGWSSFSSFHPNAVTGGTNNNFTALNFVFPTGGLSWSLAAGAFNATFKQTTCGGIGWNVYSCAKPSFIKVTSQVPASLTTTTPTMSLFGQIKNFNGQVGQENCVATFVMVGILATR